MKATARPHRRPKASRSRLRKAVQSVALILIGIAVGAAGSSGIRKAETAPRMATVYSTTSPETWNYSGNGLQYDEEAHKLVYSDTTGTRHTVYTMGYIVEIMEG